MKILVITFRLPDRLDTGDKLTIHHFLKYFSKKHEIYFVCPTASAKNLNLRLVRPYCKLIRLVKMNKISSLFNCAKGVFSSKPLQIHYYSSRQLKSIVKSIANKYNVDLIYGYHLRSSEFLLSPADFPKVLDLKPVQTLNLKRMKENITNPLKNKMYSLEYNRVKKYESFVVKMVDKCFVLSSVDKKALDKLGKFDNIAINPHGVDSDFFKPIGNNEKDHSSIIFSGNMGYDPNVDAITYFHNKIFPLIQKDFPAANLVIVGNRPSSKVMDIGRTDPSVTVTGYVDDIRHYLRRAAVGIVPMRVGAGVQNKVLEGMSMGLPMVITSIANEGVGAESYNNVIISDGESEFAKSVVLLLKDKKLSQTIGKQAREFILNKWSWDFHFSGMEKMFENIITDRNITCKPASDSNKKSWCNRSIYEGRDENKIKNEYKC